MRQCLRVFVIALRRCVNLREFRSRRLGRSHRRGNINAREGDLSRWLSGEIPEGLIHHGVVLNLNLLAIAQHQRDRNLGSCRLRAIVLRRGAALLCTPQLIDLVTEYLDLFCQHAFRRCHVLCCRIVGRRSIVAVTWIGVVAVTERWIVIGRKKPAIRNISVADAVASLNLPPRKRTDPACRRW